MVHSSGGRDTGKTLCLGLFVIYNLSLCLHTDYNISYVIICTEDNYYNQIQHDFLNIAMFVINRNVCKSLDLQIKDLYL